MGERKQLLFLNLLPSPQPSPASGRGSKRHAARSSGLTKPRPSAAMARMGFPSPLAVPRSAGRGAGAAAQHAALRALTRCGCLSGARKREASSAAPPYDRASQVARSAAEGHGQWGRLFLWLLSFWRDKKKVTAPPGAHPGQQRIQPQQQLTPQTTPQTPRSPPPAPAPTQSARPRPRWETPHSPSDAER